MEFECPICTEYYNLTNHRPKTLKCGHSLCLECLQLMFNKNGRIECPEDRSIIYESLDTIPDNQALKSQLHAMEVRCPMHEEIFVENICLTHLAVVCENCVHGGEDCVIGGIIERSQEIHMLIILKIKDLMSSLSPDLIPPDLRLKDSRKFTSGLGPNTHLLFSLQKIQRRANEVSCIQCFSEPNLFSLTTFDAFCNRCETTSPSLSVLSDHHQEDVHRLMTEKLPALLRDTNFSSLTIDVLMAKNDPWSLTSKSLQSICKAIIAIPKGPRPTYDTLPDEFLCPKCTEQCRKASCDLTVLPCKALHAICRKCANEAKFMPVLVCPLDNFSYQTPVGQLPILRPAPVQKAEAIHIPPGLFPDPPRGTIIPPARAGTHYFQRFASVLPLFGTTTPQQNGENKGWAVFIGKNQVELLVFSSITDLSICGLTIANPIDHEVVAVLQHLTIHPGKTTKERALFHHSHEEQLVGGNSVSTDIFFSQPFPVRAYTQYTLKLKLTGPVEFCTYRGSPFERPEPHECFGTDGTLWGFEESRAVEKGEHVNGQNNLSGPILRIYYTI